MQYHRFGSAEAILFIWNSSKGVYLLLKADQDGFLHQLAERVQKSDQALAVGVRLRLSLFEDHHHTSLTSE